MLLISIISLFNLQLFSQDKIISQGDWKANSYFITFEGNWEIIENNEGSYLLIHDNFSTKKAPDLKLYISKLALDNIDASNADDISNSVFIAKLNTYKGASKYRIPDEINLQEYQSIIVHCKKFDKFWGGSPLWRVN